MAMHILPSSIGKQQHIASDSVPARQGDLHQGRCRQRHPPCGQWRPSRPVRNLVLPMHGSIKAHIEWLLLRGCDLPAWHSAMAMPQSGPTPLWVAATLRMLSWMWARLPVHRSRCPLRSSMRMLRLSHLGWHAWVCRLWQYLPLARLCAALGLAHPAVLLLPTAPLRVLPRPPRPSLGTPCYPMLPVPRPGSRPSFLPTCPAWASAPPRPRLGAGPPLAAPAPSAPSRFTRPDGHDQGCPAGCQPAPSAPSRFPRPPARPPPPPRRQAAAPWPHAYADLSTLAGRGSGRRQAAAPWPPATPTLPTPS